MDDEADDEAAAGAALAEATGFGRLTFGAALCEGAGGGASTAETMLAGPTAVAAGIAGGGSREGSAIDVADPGPLALP